jgi:AcrR family transcriptional regulator
MEHLRHVRHLSKGDKTKLHILSAARRILARDGLDGLTFEALAVECGVTRQLVRGYFPRKNLIVAEIAKLIREDYQQAVVSRLDLTQGPMGAFASYVRLAIVWPLEHSDDLSVWLAYLHLTYGQSAFKDNNGFYAEAGVQRIVAMLNLCRPRRPLKAQEGIIRARAIQSIIMGTIITLSTEGQISEELAESCIERAIQTSLEVGLKSKPPALGDQSRGQHAAD